MLDIRKLGETINRRVEELDQNKWNQGLVLHPKKVEILIMGQIALLVNQEFSERFELEGTMDFDALVKANHEIEKIVDEEIAFYSLVRDKFSAEIWMPSDTEWETIFDEGFVKMQIPDPLSVIVSKAKFASEKNSNLIRKAIDEYGEELTKRLDEHGVDYEKFKK